MSAAQNNTHFNDPAFRIRNSVRHCSTSFPIGIFFRFPVVVFHSAIQFVAMGTSKNIEGLGPATVNHRLGILSLLLAFKNELAALP